MKKKRAKKDDERTKAEAQAQAKEEGTPGQAPSKPRTRRSASGPSASGASAAKAPNATRSAEASSVAEDAAEEASRTPDADFPIVVVGASAGGLEAFKRFLGGAPADGGIAYVLVPHLGAAQESFMVDLLARHSPLPVHEAAQNQPIRPDHVYVIPPNRYLAVEKRRLILSKPPETRGSQTAIDFALKSLAEDRQESAIGVILSGTGSHGTLGAKAIKLAGGIVVAQDPATADYDQMPRSVLATGLVDYVLAPERIPAALVRYCRSGALDAGAQPEADSGAAAEDGLRRILALLQARTSRDFRHYRRNMVMRRIRRRMALAGIAGVDDYLEHLRGHSDEVAALGKDLLIGVTEFFRDPDAFAVLAEKVLPDLVEHASPERPLRVWVPGCATGEEAYSIAMLLIEQLTVAEKPVNLQIFGTDIDEDSLAVARHGVYPAGIAAGIPAPRLHRFFVKVDEQHFRVGKQLRDSIVFAPQNLLGDPPFSRLDLVSCRNVLIYLNPDVHAKVISLLHFALKPGGYLMLGPSESIGRPATAAQMFEPISRKWRVFRRVGPARRDLVRIPAVAAEGRPALEPHFRTGGSGTDLAELLRSLVLHDFAPASVLIDHEFRILSVQGPLVNYLEFPPGAVTGDLLAMARRGLRLKIRGVCQRAIREGRAASDDGAHVRRDGRDVPCIVTARPVTERRDLDGLLLVVFHDLHGATHGPSGHGPSPAADDQTVVNQLEEELRATREDLQGTIEELEGANEELRASNEEIMSMNEELQSANEELESSKEELQSLNEELTTVNGQLQEKVEESDRTNNDLTNLMAATEIATLFLDPQLRIKRFTPPAGTLLNLIASDAGRPFRDFAPRFKDDDLLLAAKHVVDTWVPSQKLVTTKEDRWYLRRILPYRDEMDRVTGVVVTLIDVTAEKALREDIVTIATLEQQRIGQELHDGTQQELTGLGLLAQSLSESLGAKGEAAEAALAAKLATGIAETNRHVHELSRGLVPVPVGAARLEAALTDLARRTETSAGLECRLEYSAPAEVADDFIATHLFRIAQEAVTNAARHAQATSVQIRLHSGRSELRLEVADNGKGMQQPKPEGSGVGLRIMEDRCALIGGSLTVGQRAGGGTIVSCLVPRAQPPSRA